ncbi:MAG TPA: hypothetical protein VFQ80_01155 [Thermomicrobiales bacterium]|jgi:hypothetical protein|nr:hypothetical protein [Thermomicrobiales bacterium]
MTPRASRSATAGSRQTKIKPGAKRVCVFPAEPLQQTSIAESDFWPAALFPKASREVEKSRSREVGEPGSRAERSHGAASTTRHSDAGGIRRRSGFLTHREAFSVQARIILFS